MWWQGPSPNWLSASFNEKVPVRPTPQPITFSVIIYVPSRLRGGCSRQAGRFLGIVIGGQTSPEPARNKLKSMG
jgi:hypothetical protein